MYPCELRDKLCAWASFADGGSSRPKGPSISSACERTCSCTGHDSSLASFCLPPSGHTGGSDSLVANNMPPPSDSDDGPHTQMSFAAGGPSRSKGPSISPVSDGTCRSAEPAPSLDHALPPSLPVVCAFTCKNADSDPRDGVHCRSVSPFGFSPPSPSGLPFDIVSTGSLPPLVPPFGFSPSSPSRSPLCPAAEGLLCNPAPPLGFSAPFPKGLPRDPDFDCVLGFVTPGSTARVKHLTGEGTSLACVLQAGLCDGVPFADGGSSRLKGPSISPTCEGACSNHEHVSPLASSCLHSSDCTEGSHSLADNNMPPLAAPNDGPHTQVYLAAGHLSRPRGPSIPRQAIAYARVLHLQLLLILQFRFHCQVWARLIGAPTLISKRFPLAFWFLPLGLVLLFLVGRRPAMLLRAYCAILSPPLGLVPLPLNGWCRTPTSSTRLAL